MASAKTKSFRFKVGTVATPLPSMPVTSDDQVMIGPDPGNVGVLSVTEDGPGGPAVKFAATSQFQQFAVRDLLSQIWAIGTDAADNVQVIVRAFRADNQPVSMAAFSPGSGTQPGDPGSGAGTGSGSTSTTTTNTNTPSSPGNTTASGQQTTSGGRGGVV